MKGAERAAAKSHLKVGLHRLGREEQQKELCRLQLQLCWVVFLFDDSASDKQTAAFVLRVRALEPALLIF